MIYLFNKSLRGFGAPAPGVNGTAAKPASKRNLGAQTAAEPFSKRHLGAKSGPPHAKLGRPSAESGGSRAKFAYKKVFRAPTWRLSAFQAIARALKTIEKCCSVVKVRGSGSFAPQALTCMHSRPIWTLLELNWK